MLCFNNTNSHDPSPPSSLYIYFPGLLRAQSCNNYIVNIFVIYFWLSLVFPCRTFLDGLINPLQEQMEEWKKGVNTLDKDHAKGKTC